MPFLADDRSLLFHTFEWLSLSQPCSYFKKSEQKPPTCEDKASDSCDDDDDDKEEEEETELILELRLEVKGRVQVFSHYFGP